MKACSIAVVIPTYNAEPFICDALDSVARQTRRPEQIIIVDDGSSDRTLERIHDWARGYSGELHALQESHRGVSAARNRGIQFANTELIAFLDADDLALPHHLEQLERAFQNHPDLTLCFGDALHFDSQGPLTNTSLIGTAIESVPYETQSDGLRIMLRCAYTSLLKGNYISVSASLLSKRALERVGLFDETLRNAEDRDLFLRLSRFGSFAYYLFVVTHKRTHESNLTHPRNAVVSQRHQFMVLQKMLDRAEEMALSESERVQTQIALIEHTQTLLYTSSLQGFAAWHQSCSFLLARKKIAPVFNLRHFVRAGFSELFGSKAAGN